MPPSPDTKTMVELATSEQLVIVAVTSALGVGVGVLLPRIAGWALTLPWTPGRSTLHLIDRYATGSLAWALPVLGLVAGVLLGLSLVHETVRVQVGPDAVVLLKGDRRQRFARAEVSRVLIEDKHLVLRGRLDEDLVRQKLDVSREAVLTAIHRYDWPTAG